ncbi:hypothetical protein ESOMN_v1c04910 [Williamsoniiplasma somnilux]|uniref:J domain-containing protein n=1 Tax=Williamsoniiplasma somnilux TaxID=215578 RepID=A0A2K8P1U5_9MOLU|nr:J domain-containing protein [Williamsoniiplasma somnilux]ATZ18873.1 hypothetical protein ESOMN_v1c04910 [Williamsoniiplasma somnilux]
MGILEIVIISLVIFFLLSGFSGTTFIRRRNSGANNSRGGATNAANAFENNKRIWQHNTYKAIKIPYYQFTEFYNEFPFFSDYEETRKYLTNQGLSREKINTTIDALNSYESVLLRKWEQEQQKLLKSFDASMLGTSPQAIAFLLSVYNVWLNEFKEIIIDEFINKVVVARIGADLNHDPRTILSVTSFENYITATMNELNNKIGSITDQIITQMFQELENQHNYGQENAYSNQNNHQQTNYVHELDEVENSYKTLQLNRNCTDDDLKKQYRKLAMKYHPDKNKSESAKSKMSEINAAYDLIKKIRDIK